MSSKENVKVMLDIFSAIEQRDEPRFLDLLSQLPRILVHPTPRHLTESCDARICTAIYRIWYYMPIARCTGRHRSLTVELHTVDSSKVQRGAQHGSPCNPPRLSKGWSRVLWLRARMKS
jgi:hypothetical protein